MGRHQDIEIAHLSSGLHGQAQEGRSFEEYYLVPSACELSSYAFQHTPLMNLTQFLPRGNRAQRMRPGRQWRAIGSVFEFPQ
jgi:hypothetical protein